MLGEEGRVLAARRLHTRLPSFSGEFRQSTPLTKIRCVAQHAFMHARNHSLLCAFGACILKMWSWIDVQVPCPCAHLCMHVHCLIRVGTSSSGHVPPLPCNVYPLICPPPSSHWDAWPPTGTLRTRTTCPATLRTRSSTPSRTSSTAAQVNACPPACLPLTQGHCTQQVHAKEHQAGDQAHHPKQAAPLRRWAGRGSHLLCPASVR